MKYVLKQSVDFDEDTLRRLMIMEKYYGLNRSSTVRLAINLHYHNQKNKFINQEEEVN